MMGGSSRLCRFGRSSSNCFKKNCLSRQATQAIDTPTLESLDVENLQSTPTIIWNNLENEKGFFFQRSLTVFFCHHCLTEPILFNFCIIRPQQTLRIITQNHYIFRFRVSATRLHMVYLFVCLFVFLVSGCLWNDMRMFPRGGKDHADHNHRSI